jgi:hypothetical protein
MYWAYGKLIYSIFILTLTVHKYATTATWGRSRAAFRLTSRRQSCSAQPPKFGHPGSDAKPEQDDSIPVLIYFDVL